MKILILLFCLLFSCSTNTESSSPEPITLSQPSSIELEDIHQNCVDRINDYRASENLKPLLRWKEQETCSTQSAKEDSEKNKAHASFGKCGEFGQNECPNWPSESSILGDCLQSMWDEKKLGPDVAFSKNGHYLNMSSKRFTKVACGFYKAPNGKFWAVQNFQ